MLRKEFSEVLKQSLFFILLSVTIPFGLVFVFNDPAISYFELFFAQYHFGLLIFVLFLGNSLFLWDRKQRAADYLLSLPYSRPRLLGIKVLPRVTAAVLFYLVFLLLYGNGGEGFTVVSVFSFTYIYFSLFIIALSLSLSMENHILMAVVTLLAMAAFLGTIYLIPTLFGQLLYGADIGLSLEYLLLVKLGPGKLFFSFIGMVVGLLLPFIAAFVFAFKKTGIQPLRHFNKRYFMLFVPLFAAGVILSSVMVSFLFTPGYKSYYLTEGHRLVEWNALSIRVYGENSAVEIPHASFRKHGPIAIEAGGSLYSREYNFPENSTSFVRLDLEKQKVETFYKLENRSYSGFTGPWLFKNTIAIADGYSRASNKTLHLVDIHTKEVKKIKIRPASCGSIRVFGADEIDGKRFWLIDSKWKARHRVYRLWEDGANEELGTSRAFPYYINGVLITCAKDTAILRELIPGRIKDAGGIKTVTVGEGFVFHSYRPHNLHKPPLREILGSMPISGKNNIIRKYYILDIESLELREMKAINDKIEQSARRDPELRFHVSRRTPDEYYYREYKWKRHGIDSWEIYAFHNDKLTLLKKLPPPGEGVWLYTTRGGVIVRETGKMTVYAFPDLKELKFEKLEE